MHADILQQKARGYLWRSANVGAGVPPVSPPIATDLASSSEKRQCLTIHVTTHDPRARKC
jgi:hypothetical protein